MSDFTAQAGTELTIPYTATVASLPAVYYRVVQEPEGTPIAIARTTMTRNDPPGSRFWYTELTVPPAESYAIQYDEGDANNPTDSDSLLSTVGPPSPTPASGAIYVTVAELKATLSLTNQSYADADILVALQAASRGLEDAYETYWRAPATDTRYYTRSTSRIVHLGDVQSITSVDLDYALSDVYGQLWDWDTGLGKYGTPLDPSWYRLLPIQNGPSGNGEPYQQLQLNRASQRYILPSGADAIRITGTFGWTSVPAGVNAAVKIIATRILERTRAAPFGIIALGADGIALRARDIAQDPDIRFAMGPAAGTTSLFA